MYHFTAVVGRAVQLYDNMVAPVGLLGVERLDKLSDEECE